MNIYDHPLYQSFVNPDNCRLLVRAGLNTDTPFVWKMLPNNNVQLFTLAFDDDNYYSIGQRYLQEFKPQTLPAFQLKDMEKLLPDYYMEKQGQLYRLLCTTWFENKQIQDERLPDAFARMIYTGLLEKKIHPYMAIELINKAA